MIERKNCPFCGSKADPGLVYEGDYYPVTFLICSKCRARGPLAHLTTTNINTEDEAVRLWNKRYNEKEEIL